jgi:hypothetical protein
MPTYFLTNTISDVANTYTMDQLPNAGTTLLVSLAGGATANFDFITAEYYPNSNGQTSTSGNVVVEFTVTNMTVTVIAQKHRVSSTGTILASGTASASTAVSASPLTFTNLDDPTYTTTNCGDRIMLRLAFTNGSMTVANSVTIGTDRIGSYAVSSINHNTLPGCTLLRKRPYISTEK